MKRFWICTCKRWAWRDHAAPDHSAWTLGAEPAADHVRVHLSVPACGFEVAIQLSREEARVFARAVLAAAGDGTERTFPKPIEAIHG